MKTIEKVGRFALVCLICIGIAVLIAYLINPQSFKS